MDQCRHTLEQHNWNIEVLLHVSVRVGTGFLTVTLHLLAPEFTLLVCYNNIVMLLESQFQNCAAEFLELQLLVWCYVLPCSVHMEAVMEKVFYEEITSELYFECSGSVGKCYLHE